MVVSIKGGKFHLALMGRKSSQMRGKPLSKILKPARVFGRASHHQAGTEAPTSHMSLINYKDTCSCCWPPLPPPHLSWWHLLPLSPLNSLPCPSAFPKTPNSLQASNVGYQNKSCKLSNLMLMGTNLHTFLQFALIAI